MVERVSTGVKGLDDMIDGGFERNRVFLFKGDSGCGKTTFAASFAHAGLVNGEKVLYISLEETPEIFTENMSRIGLSFKEHLESKALTYYHLSPEIVRDTTTCLSEVTSLLKTQNFSRAIVDSITAFLLLFEEDAEKRDNLTRLLETLRRSGLTVLLTSEIEYDTARFGLSYLVDGVVNLLYREKEDGMTRIRLVEVYKMRGTNHSTTKVFFKIEPGDGIIITRTKPFGYKKT